MKPFHATIIRDGILSARLVLNGAALPGAPIFQRRADARLWFHAYWRTLQRTTAARTAARMLKNAGYR